MPLSNMHTYHLLFQNMVDDDNRRRQIVNEDIKRILIDRDITTIKQAFYRILCSEIRNKDTRVFIPHKLFSHGRLEDYLSNKELEFDDSDNKPTFPRGVIAVSDIITLVEDMGNQIPNKSWMVYLLELFNSQNIPAELNLICSFNNDGKFDAIFNGVNQYQFKQIFPVVGHSYIRQIVMNLQKH